MSLSQGSYLPSVNALRTQQETITGLTPDEWNQLVASKTGPGVSAAAAAHEVNPYYLAKRGESRSLAGLGTDGRGHTPWQEVVSQCTRETGLNAAACAHQISPAYEAAVGGVSRHSTSTRSRSRSRSRSPVRTEGYDLTTSGYGRSRSPVRTGSYGLTTSGYGRAGGFDGMYSDHYRRNGSYDGAYPATNQNVGSGLYAHHRTGSDVNFTPQELGATMTPEGLVDLDRPSYQILIEQLTSTLGINAAQAAKLLSEVIASKNKRPGLTREQWYDLISQTAQNYGVNAAQAAQILSSEYRGRYRKRESPITEEIFPAESGLESGMGYYEGENGARSFRAGTPAESGDIVLDPETATMLTAVDASSSPGYLTARSDPSNRSYLTKPEYVKVARALGLNPDGTEPNQLLVQSIRNRLNVMTSPQRQQVLGNLSPRTYQGLTSLL